MYDRIFVSADLLSANLTGINKLQAVAQKVLRANSIFIYDFILI